MAKYKVRPGFTHGASKQYKAGDIVELTEEEAAGFLDKLEPYSGRKKAADEEATGGELRTLIQAASDDELADALGVDADAFKQLRQGKGVTRPGGLVVNPTPGDAPATKAEAVQDTERELEAETGKDFTVTGTEPPTLAESDSGKSPTRVPRR